jgi:hypothetical protein
LNQITEWGLSVMKIRHWLFALGAVALAFTSLKPAAAATIDYTVNFGASSFSGTPPVGFVLGEFAFSLDTAANGSGSVTANFLNLAVGALSFDYSQASDNLFIGGDLTGIFGQTSGTDDLIMLVQNFTTSPTFVFLSYTQVGSIGYFDSFNGAVHVEPFNTAVTPIPAALPLFLSALGGMGYLGWRRRKSAAA